MSAAQSAKNVGDVDKANSAEELTSLSPEELQVINMAIEQEAISPEEKRTLREIDKITICRGYQNEKDRQKTTNEALVKILNFRVENNWHEVETGRLEFDKEFGVWWEERVYGADAEGHLVVGFRYEDIKTNEMTDNVKDDDHLLKLQAQKVHHLNLHKERCSIESGNQRYKHTYIVDLKGSGMGLLVGKKSSLIKRLFGMGSDMFPEIIWKIHIINAPFMFRAMWAAVKGWVHPATQAKINVHSNLDKAVEAMKKLGLEPASIPTWCKGTSKGKTLFDIMIDSIEKCKKERKEAGKAKNTGADEAGAAPTMITQQSTTMGKVVEL